MGDGRVETEEGEEQGKDRGTRARQEERMGEEKEGKEILQDKEREAEVKRHRQRRGRAGADLAASDAVSDMWGWMWQWTGLNNRRWGKRMKRAGVNISYNDRLYRTRVNWDQYI